MTDIPATASALRLRRDGDTLVATLSRPRVRNAVDDGMLRGLEAIIAEAALDGCLRIVVLEGEGGYFCAGGDLTERATIAAGPDGEGLARRNRREGELLNAMAGLPQLVVGLVEGGAVGAGLGMLCVCDLVLAREGSVFAAPEVADGAVPAQISPHLVRRVGASQARRMLLTGTRIETVEAIRIGLVHEAISEETDLEQARADLLVRLARCDRAAIAATKRLLAELQPLDPGYPARAAEFYQAQFRRKRAGGGR
ncbi:enoyl-CoA hydratase/isomerase family protein [Bosea sp. NPDC055594]